MKVKLTHNDYSHGQRTLFALLPKNGRSITTAELVRKRKNWPVQFPAQGMSGAMRALMGKVAANDEPFRICKSYRAGPHQVRYWIETKQEIYGK